MAKGTKIEWADDTVNAEMGCDGCELWDPKNSVRSCYAGVQTERMLSKGQLKGWPPAFHEPTIFPRRIAEAARWPRARTKTGRSGCSDAEVAMSEARLHVTFSATPPRVAALCGVQPQSFA